MDQNEKKKLKKLKAMEESDEEEEGRKSTYILNILMKRIIQLNFIMIFYIL